MSRPLPTFFDQALDAAIQAPSPHNTQPWRFVVGDDHVEVWLDPGRVLPVADPDAHEARLACGAALLNFVVSLRASGKRPAVRLVPDKDRADLLAVVRIIGDRESSLSDRKLEKAVHLRHTNRRPFLDQEVPPGARSSLANAASDEGGLLEFLDPSAKYDAVARLVRRAEVLQSTEPEFVAEAARWTHREPDSPDGVPHTAAGPPPEYTAAIALRESHSDPALPPRPFEQQPLLAAVCTRGQGIHAEVQGGMVMQRVLLTATSIGLATSFLSQPFETPSTRSVLDDLFRWAGKAHTLLRIGYGFPAPVTARRPVSEVASHHDGPVRSG